MQAQRYQRGSLSILKRKSQPDAWAFRYYTEEDGHRSLQTKINRYGGRIPQAQGRGKGGHAAQGRRQRGAAFASMNVEQLAAQYQSVEIPLKAHSTAEGYKNFLKIHVIPKWGKHALPAIKSVEVEIWLRNLKKINGQPASPATKSKIRNLMSALFSHAIRNEWAARNPITSVRTSAKRLRTPDILTASEFQALLSGIVSA
jgi:hypothetical protein